jgi:hypothetical protein
VAQKLLQLVKAGATILIDPATNYHSNTLANAAAEDSIVKAVFRQLLSRPGTAMIGHGRVIIGPWKLPTLDSLDIARDVITNSKAIAYTHRQSADMDIYFLSNQSDQPIDTTLSFHTTSRMPELWDPLTGEITIPANYNHAAAYMYVQCALQPHGSVFVVFRRPANDHLGNTSHEPRPAATVTLTGPWSVQFDTAFGGPAKTQHFNTLIDWTASTDSNIRYYSGPAIYTATFHYARTDKHVLLDLGAVHDIATVTLNGIDCGTVWTGNKLELTKAIRQGDNKIKITVTNTWNNRLTGNEHLPENQRRTWTTAPKRPDGSLLPAGLLGPIKIIIVQK